jgi:tRNA(Ile)-lysidine synthase
MARQLRNQAIGLLCRDRNMRSFMLAHHLDDQAEGIVLRLMRNRLRTGLIGMKSVEWIPECHGIHGVYHSSKTARQLDIGLPFPLESGGIQALRPLLGFSKSRLIATCKEHGTTWVEDKTNQDVTLTNRNAIRHIFRNHKLPAALSRDSLVSLAVHMKKRLDSHKEIVDDLFEKCPMKLDIQTGSLVVRLPPVASLLDRPILTESDILLARTSAILLVSRLASLVSPKTSASTLGQLSSSIDIFYPALRTRHPTHAMLRVWERPDSTWANIWFRRWDKPSPFRLSDDHMERLTMEWLMNRRRVINNVSSLYDHQIIVPTLRIDPSSDEKWHLFDDRYWMRVKNHGSAPLKIRNFEPEDVKTLSEDNKKAPTADRPCVRSDHLIKTVIMLIKDKRLRRGFPGIFSTDEEGRDILVALPTFNFTVRLSETANENLHYDIRYKKIDMGNRSLDDIVVPVIAKAQIADAIRNLMYSKTEPSLPAISKIR